MDKKTYDKLMSSYTEKMELLWTSIGQEIIYLWEEAYYDWKKVKINESIREDAAIILYFKDLVNELINLQDEEEKKLIEEAKEQIDN